MIEYTSENITAAAIDQMSTTKDERLKTIMESAVRHLHAFAREVNLTPSEWIFGIQFLTRVGHMCSPARQEFILLSDTLGLSTLVIGLPDSVAKLQAKLMDKLPTRPFSLDNYHSLQQDSIVGGEDGFALLGIVPRSVEGVMPRELRARDHRGPYAAYRASAGR